MALSVTGLPAGATAVFSPAALTTGAGTATLTVTVPAATPSGTSTLHVKGTSGASIHEALVNLTVLDERSAVRDHDRGAREPSAARAR